MRRNINKNSLWQLSLELIAALAILLVTLMQWGCEGTHVTKSSQPSPSGPKASEAPVAGKLDLELSEEVEVEEIIFFSVPEEEERALLDGGQYQVHTEEYAHHRENPFHSTFVAPLSTFSIDVDHASYAHVRRYLENNQLPPPDAVRIEEMINYFDYDYPDPKEGLPFSISTETGICPWDDNHRLIHIGIQGKRLQRNELHPSNLTFLVDVSGSMDQPNKLPLVQQSLRLLLNNLHDEDQVAIVGYAGRSDVLLESTKVENRAKIQAAIARMSAGGGTAGGEGIQLAYQIAEQNFNPGGNNRIVLVTDGDFNIGVSSTGDLVRLIQEKRATGIYLTICGFGMGNYKDYRMEEISNAGNGNYYYIDHIREAEKVFQQDLTANLFTIAKDVKVQVAFNPRLVKQYRLIGYENRALETEDFDDDQVDAGELGAGHTVTCLYEIVPGEALPVTASKYVETKPTVASMSNDLVAINLRYKEVDSDQSQLMVHTVGDETLHLSAASSNYKLSAAVAGFGMLLRQSRYRQHLAYEDLIKLAGTAYDSEHQEFLQLVRTAQLLENN